MKPFEIQGTTLSIGGVDLQAGTTGVVIPGITRAASYIPEEVEKQGDDSSTWTSVPVIIDQYTYLVLLNQQTPPQGWTAPEYEAVLDGNEIDEINIVDPGAGINDLIVGIMGDNIIAAPAGSSTDPETFDINVWEAINWTVKCEVGEVELDNSGGGGGGADTGNLVLTSNTIKGTSIGQEGTLFVIESDNGLNPGVTENNAGGTFNSFELPYNNNTLLIQAGWTVTTSNGNPSDSALPFTFTVDSVETNGTETIVLFANGTQFGNPSTGTALFPITIKSDDYVAGTDPVVQIQPDSTDASVKFTFDGNRLYFPGGEPSIYSADNSEITVSTPGNIELNNTGGTWTFGSDGNLKLPAGSDIVDSTGNSVLGGGTSLSPELTKSGGNLVATTTLEFQGNVYGAIFDIDSGGDFDVWLQSVTGGDDGMSYAIGSNSDGYDFVYAFNASGTVSWKVGLDDISSYDNTAYGIKYSSGYVYLSCQYYSTDVQENQLSVVKLNADDGTVATSWVLTNASGVQYRPRDITVNSSGDPIVVGESYNETQTFSGLTPQTGSGSKVLVVNASDLNNAGQTNPWGSYYVHTDPNDASAWYQTASVNRFLNVPTVVLTGTGDGTLTVDIRYMYYPETSSWRYDYVTIPNAGAGYNMGDQVKVLGSSIGGTDVVDDIIMSNNSWQMNVLSVGGVSGDTCPSFVSSKIRLNMTQTVDFSTGTWDVRIGLGSQAFVWTPNWQHSYGSVDSQSFESVNVDSSGNVYLLGQFDYNDGSNTHTVLAMKLNSSGVQQWVKYIEDDSNGSQDPGSIFTDSSGNSYVISENNNGYTLVTKLDSAGAVVWQVKQTDSDSWDNYAVGGLDGNEEIVIMGSWYNGNNNVTNIHKLSSASGSLLWSRDFSNQQDYDMYEYYDEDGQAGHVVGDNFYYGGYCYDSNNNQYVGFGFRLPTDGTGTGTYGRYVYSENTNTAYTDNTSNAVVTDHTYDPIDSVSMTGVATSASTTVDAVGTTTSNHWYIGTGGGLTGVDSITFSDGSVLTTADVIGWTPGNNIVQTIDTELRIVVKDPNQSTYSIDLAVEDDIGTVNTRMNLDYDRVQIETNTGQKQWRFESNGELRIPGNISTFDNDINIVAMNAGAAGNITIKTVSNSNDIHFSSIDLNQSGVNITVDMDNTPGGKSFEFRDSGILVLPSGADIQDAYGVSVIGKEPKFTLKYQNFNAESGTRYCIDAIGSAVTAMLPATPATGDAIYFVDAFGSFSDNNLTIDGNGNTIMGSSTLVLYTASGFVGVFYNGAEWRTY